MGLQPEPATWGDHVPACHTSGNSSTEHTAVSVCPVLENAAALD